MPYIASNVKVFTKIIASILKETISKEITSRFFFSQIQSSDSKASVVPEIQVQSLGWEDLLEKEVATHSSTLAWKIPWTEESGTPQPMGSQRVRHD